MLDHEKEIKQLKNEVQELKNLVNIYIKEKWQTLKESEKYTGISPNVVKRRILKGYLEKGKDWRMNGNRYLVNSENIKKKIG